MKLSAIVQAVKVGLDFRDDDGRTVTFRIVWPWAGTLELNLTVAEAAAYTLGRRVDLVATPERLRPARKGAR